jgi:Sulfate permease family
MNLSEQILGVGMRRRFQAPVDQLNFPRGPVDAPRGPGDRGSIPTLGSSPQVLAYADVAGLPPVVGLWAIVGPLLVYAVLGSSRQLSVGPESTTALMTASVVARLWPFWPLISTGLWVYYSLRFAFTDELPVDRYINPARPAADGHRRGAGRPTFKATSRYACPPRFDV